MLNEGFKKCEVNGGEDEAITITLWEEAMQFYADPCKSTYLVALRPYR